MKKTNITLFICTLLICVPGLETNAQDLKDSDVPSAVKTKFISMYPGINNPKWEMENGKYEAEFTENSTETSVLFEANGSYVQTETEIPVSSLPPLVSEYVAKNFSGKTITEACEVTSASGSVTYEVEIGKVDYLFDSNGNVLGKETDSNNSEDYDK